MTKPTDYDVIILGGGPVGAAAGTILAQHGRKVVILEKETFPRFHVGESFLPELNPCFKRLGITEKVKRVPHIYKNGVEFVFGHERWGHMLEFKDCAHWAEWETFNTERAAFDTMLLDHAKESGAEVRKCAVRKAAELTDGFVRVETDQGELTAKYLFDASGQHCFLGRQLGLRKTWPDHRKTAFVGHFEDMERHPGPRGTSGNPSMVMTEEGWFWVIPLDDKRTSIGMVLDVEAVKKMNALGVTAKEAIQWGVRRCPHIAQRLVNAKFPEQCNVVSDYSYYCEKSAGPGFFLLGDAAVFLDPIFSSGVYLGVSGAIEAADLVHGILDGKISPEAARKRHASQIKAKTKPFFFLITNYYTHSFRELFREGSGPFEVHKALLSILMGRVQNVPFSVRWRIQYFKACLWVHRNLKRLCKPYGTFSVLRDEAAEGKVVHTTTA